MKVRLLLVALVLAGCSSPAVDPETEYLEALYEMGHPRLETWENRESSVSLGYAVCEVYEAGGNDGDVYEAMGDGGASAVQIDMVSTAAKAHLCSDTSRRP